MYEPALVSCACRRRPHAKRLFNARWNVGCENPEKDYGIWSHLTWLRRQRLPEQTELRTKHLFHYETMLSDQVHAPWSSLFFAIELLQYIYTNYTLSNRRRYYLYKYNINYVIFWHMFQAYFAYKFNHAHYFYAPTIPKPVNLGELCLFKPAYVAQEFSHSISVWNSLT